MLQGIPGIPVGEVLSIRLIKAFLYKFFRHINVVRRNFFDPELGMASGGKRWRFYFGGPYISDFDGIVSVDRNVLNEPFFQASGNVFWFIGGRVRRGHVGSVFCVEPKDFSDYFMREEYASSYSGGLIYVFDSSFSWYINIKDSLREGVVDDADYVYLLFKKS